MIETVEVNLEALGRAVKQVQYRHNRALDSRFATIGTTLAQWDALRAIDHLPGASAHKLSLATFQSDQAFGVLCNRLTTMLSAGHPIMRDVLATSFAALSNKERALLLSLLQRVVGEEGADFILPTSKELV